MKSGAPLGLRRRRGRDLVFAVEPNDPVAAAARSALVRAIGTPQVVPGGFAFEARLVQRASTRSVRYEAAQRIFDLTVAAVALVLASPLLVGCAAAVRLTSRGPVVFRQVRIGRRGQAFQCLKFRTMCVDAESKLSALLLKDEEARTTFEAAFKLDDDPRITRVGRFLRRTSLDELPQLFNVLRGEMSIVGPRPVVPEELARYGDFGQVVLQVRPGMTGSWQVERSVDTTYAERVRLDIDYVLHRSLPNDVKIVSQTLRRLRTAGADTSR
jgi:undecaprenyl-phosphate galactose phosphotransferase